MARVVPFPHAGDTDDGADRPTRGSLADKLQRLVLLRPLAAKEVEKLIDRLLASPRIR